LYQGATKQAAKKLCTGQKSKDLRGFYETAVESKASGLVFLLLGVFAFAVVFAFVGTTSTLWRIHPGLLYALEESRPGLGA
jgi:hypothetical protein